MTSKSSAESLTKSAAALRKASLTKVGSREGQIGTKSAMVNKKMATSVQANDRGKKGREEVVRGTLMDRINSIMALQS